MSARRLKVLLVTSPYHSGVVEAAVLEARRMHPSWTTALGSAEARFGSLTPALCEHHWVV